MSVMLIHCHKLCRNVDRLILFANICTFTPLTTIYDNFCAFFSLCSINRYYLEPASPLKSLTNATQFGFSQSNGSQSTQSQSSLENGNHNNHTNGTALWSLAPPGTLNLNANNKILPAPPSIKNFQEQFTPDDNSLFNRSSNGSSSTDGSDANANFADFEHNTIYNAAGELARTQNTFSAFFSFQAGTQRIRSILNTSFLCIKFQLK